MGQTNKNTDMPQYTGMAGMPQSDGTAAAGGQKEAHVAGRWTALCIAGVSGGLGLNRVVGSLGHYPLWLLV